MFNKPPFSTNTSFGFSSKTTTTSSSGQPKPFGNIVEKSLIKSDDTYMSTSSILDQTTQPSTTRSMFEGFSGSSFGQQNKSTLFSGSCAPTTQLFGQKLHQIAENSIFAPATFGNKPTSGTTTKFEPAIGTDVTNRDGTAQYIRTKFHTIAVMKEYESKSYDELRWEDYQDGRKGPVKPSFEVKQIGIPAPGKSEQNKLLFGQSTGSGRPTFGFSSKTSQKSGFGTHSSILGAKGSGLGTTKTVVLGTQSSILTSKALGFGTQTSGLGLQSSFFGNKTLGLGTQSAGFGSKTVGGQSSGFGSKNLGFDTQSSGFGTKTSAFGTQSTGLGSKGFGTQSAGFCFKGFGTQSPGFGNENSAVDNGSCAFGNQNSGLGNQSCGFGNQTSGFGSQTSGFGNQTSGFGNQTSGFSSQTPGFGNEFSMSTPPVSNTGNQITSNFFKPNNVGTVSSHPFNFNITQAPNLTNNQINSNGATIGSCFGFLQNEPTTQTTQSYNQIGNGMFGQFPNHFEAFKEPINKCNQGNAPFPSLVIYSIPHNTVNPNQNISMNQNNTYDPQHQMHYNQLYPNNQINQQTPFSYQSNTFPLPDLKPNLSLQALELISYSDLYGNNKVLKGLTPIKPTTAYTTNPKEIKKILEIMENPKTRIGKKLRTLTPEQHLMYDELDYPESIRKNRLMMKRCRRLKLPLKQTHSGSVEEKANTSEQISTERKKFEDILRSVEEKGNTNEQTSAERKKFEDILMYGEFMRKELLRNEEQKNDEGNRRNKLFSGNNLLEINTVTGKTEDVMRGYYYQQFGRIEKHMDSVRNNATKITDETMRDEKSISSSNIETVGTNEKSKVKEEDSVAFEDSGECIESIRDYSFEDSSEKQTTESTEDG